MFKYLIAKLRCNRGEVGTVDPAKTDEPGAKKDDSSQGGQADKLEGLISDIDLSDVPENIREDVKKHLAEKVKNYDSGFRAKTEEFSKDKKEFESKKESVRDLMKLRDEIDGNPKLKDKITKTINNFRAGNFDEDNSSTSKGKKMLDKLIDDASDAETKQGLMQMRQIVQEETSTYGELKDNYKALEEKFQKLEQATVSGHTERVEAKISVLEDRFGKDIVDKYRGDIRDTALKFPTQDTVKLFYHLASEDDIKSALLNEAKTEKQREEQRKEQGSGAGLIDSKTPIEPKKDKLGRTNIKDLVGQIRNKYQS
jgi:hypothetical protein